MPELDDDELLDALGVEATPTKTETYSATEERLIAGFEEIIHFCREQGRPPRAGGDGDIFERLLAVRLARLRALPEAVTFLASRDPEGLLAAEEARAEDLDDEALLAELGVTDDGGEGDIRTLRHVESFEARTAAEEVATRTKCADFERFQPLFEKVERELRTGARKTVHLRTRSLDAIQRGTYFVVSGQIAYIAKVTEPFTTSYERQDSRLRVIYDNGTESDLLQRSFQRALHRDELARVITDPDAGPLFGGPVAGEPLFGQALEEGDVASGTIYVLRSWSDHPFVTKHRDLVHKIGVTTGKVETRISQATKDATYLLAEVEVVATYALANINPTKLENVFHRLFASAQIDLTIQDRFGHPVRPREWFLVPLGAIDEAVSRMLDGSIMDFEYSTAEARLVPRGG